jgi:arabinogalactan endo-1,4-beta-galactosidase
MKKKKGRGWMFALLLCAGLCAAGCGEAGESQSAEKTGDEQADTYTAVLPTAAEEADIYVEPIENLPEDYIKGMDVSSVIAEEESGVVYYNEAGEVQDVFQTLADAGINYIRVRVWNDPYDKDGNGYGGGNCDVEKAAEIGARAAQYGMKLMVDFHYSDFWADPSKQKAPKEWAHYSLQDKETAIYEYTKESLETIAAAGADIGMVQIGNEINNGMAGETEWERIIPLLEQASSAVRESSEELESDIRVVVHFTDIEDETQLMKSPQMLEEAGLDYDVFGVSYYPYWHGDMEHLTEVLQNIQDTYGKKTIVAETSYAYTLEEGDGTANSVSELDLVDGYAASVQSQATCIRDVMAAASAAGEDNLGVFYWEGAWIPVGAASEKEENEKIWEQYGSGWASSYAAKYDPDDAGQYYGGCSWENQALFDFDGKPLASLNVFKYVNYGTICDLKIDYISDCEVKVNVGEALTMPETVEVVYNDRSASGAAAVEWEEAQYSNIDTSKKGEYTVEGHLEDAYGNTAEVSCLVQVDQVNWVENPGFEEKNTSMWKVSYEGDSNPTDVQTKETDAYTGENSFHFWSKDEPVFTIEQTITGLDAGAYTLTAALQGGDVGKDAQIYIYAVVDGETYQSEPVTLNGWRDWQLPEINGIRLDGTQDITVGISVKAAKGGWGTIDDVYLYKE